MDRNGYERICQVTAEIEEAICNEQFSRASDLEAKVTATIMETTQGIDIYNIIHKSNDTALPGITVLRVVLGALHDLFKHNFQLSSPTKRYATQ